MLRIGKFINQVRTEMKKVSWPSKAELIGSTIVVLLSTLILAIYIGICDLFFSRFINFLVSGVLR